MNQEIIMLTMLLIGSVVCDMKRLKFCGTHLSEAIQLACEDRGYNVWDGESPIVAQPVSNPDQNGIVYECCKLGCTWATLVSYCKNSNASGKINSMDDLLKEKRRAMGIYDVKALASSEVPVKKMRKRRRMRKKHHMERLGREGLEGDAPFECRRRRRPARTRKMDYDSFKRSAPVFGTVSPEYQRQPRTLDALPIPYRGMQGF